MAFSLKLSDLLLLLLLNLLESQLENVGGLVSLMLGLGKDRLGLTEF